MGVVFSVEASPPVEGDWANAGTTAPMIAPRRPRRAEATTSVAVWVRVFFFLSGRVDVKERAEAEGGHCVAVGGRGGAGLGGWVRGGQAGGEGVGLNGKREAWLWPLCVFVHGSALFTVAAVQGESRDVREHFFPISLQVSALPLARYALISTQIIIIYVSYLSITYSCTIYVLCICMFFYTYICIYTNDLLYDMIPIVSI